MEFELEDYKSGRKIKKVRNLNYINSTGYNNNQNNYNKKNVQAIYNKAGNKAKKDLEKSLNANSKNNNDVIAKLKKENESLKLMISEYESNIIKYKISQKISRYRRMDNDTRIARKTTGSKPQSITKNLNNLSNFGNNTYTTNFYYVKKNNNNKYNTINNSLLLNNKTNEITNALTSKIPSMNSYIIHNKKIVKRRSKKSLSVFRSVSKNKSKSKTKKLNKNIYDKVKTNYKKITNNVNKNSNENVTDIKIKEKEKKSELGNNNMNMSHSRLYTLNNNNNNNNNNYSKNTFTYKKKVNQNNEKVVQANNICNTERKKTEENLTNLNSNTENLKSIPNINKMDRNACSFMNKNEFNLTWSKFPKKEEEPSFDNYLTEANQAPPCSIMSAKNITKIENRKGRKYITKVKNSIDKFDNYRIKHKKEINPQKITINRKIIANKMKNNKNLIVSNNVSMKNIINLPQKNKKNGLEDNKNLSQNIINTSASNKMMSIHNNLLHDGDMYNHKGKDSLLASNYKNNTESTNDLLFKKNTLNAMNNKYNVTINNINNCNYFNLIQGANNKPEIKIIKKRINKNN